MFLERYQRCQRTQARDAALTLRLGVLKHKAEKGTATASLAPVGYYDY